MPWKPSPPKKSETDGKAVKAQQVAKFMHKRLDKPLKTVYNIRKDVMGVQYLYDTFLKGNRGIPFSPDNNLYAIKVANETVVNISHRIGIDIPVLAGGALRDLVFNKWPKDFDYFINCNDEDHAYEVMDKLCLDLKDYTEGGPGDKYETENVDFEGVYGVFNKTFTNLPLQFIVGVWPVTENFYDRFDLSVCQAEMDIITGDIKFSEAFLETLRTKTIRAFNTSEYTRLRQERLSWTLNLMGRASKFSDKLVNIDLAADKLWAQKILNAHRAIQVENLAVAQNQWRNYEWILNDEGVLDARPAGDAVPPVPIE